MMAWQKVFVSVLYDAGNHYLETVFARLQPPKPDNPPELPDNLTITQISPQYLPSMGLPAVAPQYIQKLRLNPGWTLHSVAASTCLPDSGSYRLFSVEMLFPTLHERSFAVTAQNHGDIHNPSAAISKLQQPLRRRSFSERVI